MAQINNAKQRMIRSGSIAGTSNIRQYYQPYQTHKQYLVVRQPSNAGSPNSKYQFIDHDQPSFSPEFARTQRVYPIQKWNDRQSEFNYQQSSIKQRRNTNYDYHQSRIRQASTSSQNKKSHIQSSNNQLKKTVRSQKIAVIIAPVCIRVAQSPVKPKQCLNEIVLKNIEQETNKGEGYKDHMFPGRQSIIFTKRTMCQQEGLAFQRLTRIYQNNILKVVEYAQPSYIIQGKFSSPAVYSAMTILAEDPSRVANIFYNQTVNEIGMYYVHLCKDGVWKYITIDDYVPIKFGVKKVLLFMHSVGVKNSYEIWPSLIQKALSKIYGTYEDVNLCMDLGIRDIFRILTGYPVSQYDLNKDFRSYLILIDNALKKKQVVVVEKIHPQLEQIATSHKINIHKSYLIVDAKKNYITIRNLDDNQLITKLTVQQVMIFSKLLIFKNEKNYVYISQTLRHKKHYYSLLHLQVPIATKCYFDIWENNPAYYKSHLNSNVNYKISKYQIIIKPIDQIIEDNEQQILTESGKQITLKQGKYQIIIHLCQSKEQDFTFSYYGQQKIQIKRVKNLSKWNKKQSNHCQCQIQ